LQFNLGVQRHNLINCIIYGEFIISQYPQKKTKTKLQMLITCYKQVSNLQKRSPNEIKLEIIHYFDATESNWNTFAQSRPLSSLCIKKGSQIRGWVSSSLDHVIYGGQKYTISLPSGRAMSVD